MGSGEVPARRYPRSPLTPGDPGPRPRGSRKALPATHFFRNSDATSSCAVSAPRKASEPRHRRATGTSFIPAAMRRPLGREGEECELRNLRTALAGHRGRAGAPARAASARVCLARTLLSPGRREAPAAFALAERVTRPRRGGLCPAPGSLLNSSEFG